MLIEDFVPTSRSVWITNALLRAHGTQIARPIWRSLPHATSLWTRGDTGRSTATRNGPRTDSCGPS